MSTKNCWQYGGSRLSQAQRDDFFIKMETINKCIDIIWHTSLLKNPYLKSRTHRHRHATTPNHVQIPKFLTRIVAFIANSTTKYHKSKPQRQPIANSYPTREKPRKGKKSINGVKDFTEEQKQSHQHQSPK